VGSLVGVFKKFKQLTNVLPAMGYGARQIDELEKTINASDCDAVIVGTPIDLRRVLKNVNKPMVRVHYELDETDPALLKSMVLRAAGRKRKCMKA
jgi:predicted GTPase